MKFPIPAARLLVLGVALVSPAAVMAQSGRAADPSRMTLEELMAMRITTASRHEQVAEDVAAAVRVITRDDIRRSGYRTLPEVFRLVPGVQVARVNASNWAVSIRGSNGPFANKLLVLVDGRSIYNRGFSGVFWSTEDLVLDDIQRIEVVRGSGAAVWGANAVNGVINIVTRSAADTQGVLVRLGHESFDGSQGTLRYGGTAGALGYRLFSQWSEHGPSQLSADRQAQDGWRSVTNGVRADWESGRSAVMGAATLNVSTSRSLWKVLLGPAGPPVESDRASERYTGSVFGRWTQSFEDGSALRVQSFFNHRDFHDPVVEAHERTADLDADYHRAVGARHAIVFGGGLRQIRERYVGTYAVSFLPAKARTHVINAFVQDEIRLARGVRLTAGARIERDSVSGWELQPTGRAAWDIVPSRHLVWAAISRAARTPSATNLSALVNYKTLEGPNRMPMVVRIVGNPDYKSERFTSGEIGYRTFVRSALSIDAAAFYGRYDGLASTEPLPPTFELAPVPHMVLGNRFDNLLDATTRGFELSAHWAPARAWRVDGSYSAFELTAQPQPRSLDQNAAAYDGNAPAQQWQLHTTWSLAPRVEAQGSIFHVGRLVSLGIPAYVRADARIEIEITDKLSVIGTAHNLLDATHREYASDGVMMTGTQIPRSAGIQLSWRY